MLLVHESAQRYGMMPLTPGRLSRLSEGRNHGTTKGNAQENQL
jgi:hypothetical protein